MLNIWICYYLQFHGRARVMCGRKAKHRITSSKAMLRSGVSSVTGRYYSTVIGWMSKVAESSIGQKKWQHAPGNRGLEKRRGDVITVAGIRFSQAGSDFHKRRRNPRAAIPIHRPLIQSCIMSTA